MPSADAGLISSLCLSIPFLPSICTAREDLLSDTTVLYLFTLTFLEHIYWLGYGKRGVWGHTCSFQAHDMPADLRLALTDAVSMGTAASAIRRRSARAAFPVHDVFAFFFRVACFCSYSAAYKRGWSSCSLLPTPISDEFSETRKRLPLTRPLWRVVDELEQDERINE